MLEFTGTGDHTFERRLRLGGPLLKENIATMVLERWAFFHVNSQLQIEKFFVSIRYMLVVERYSVSWLFSPILPLRLDVFIFVIIYRLEYEA